MSGATSYPLDWPSTIPRSKGREKSRFKTNYAKALENVIRSLRGFGGDSGKNVTGAVMSSNMDLLNNRPSDPGVAVYFTWDGMPICIPVDRYETPAENLQAIHHILEARRTEIRHGTLHLVRASFQGFKALPSPAGARKRSWWEVLGVKYDASEADIAMAYKVAAFRAHPDRGGSEAAMAEINQARDEALKAQRTTQ